MRLIALIAARDEAWSIGYSLRAALRWVDAAVVLAHACTDGTEAVVEQVVGEGGDVRLLVEPDPEWREMAHRQRMLDEARRMGATHVAMVDADEVLTANLEGAVRAAVAKLAPGQMIEVPWLNLWRSLDVYRNDGTRNGRQWVNLVFGDHRDLGWGGAERFHHRHPRGIHPTAALRVPQTREAGGLMHLQRASWRRACARQDLYRMLEVTRWPGREPVHEVDARYAMSLDEVGAGLLPVPKAWWRHGLDRGMIDLCAAPWEAAECRRMLDLHGWARFNGLNLAGGW